MASLAVDRAEKVEGEAGPEAAQAFYDLATQPERLTLLEALAEMNADPGARAGTTSKREHAVHELLAFLKLEDCLPSYVTEARAVAYVRWLNDTAKTPQGNPLGRSTKQDRLSNFSALWKFLQRRRQLPRGSTVWTDHDLTGAKAGPNSEMKKRGYRDDEIVALLGAPDDNGRGHYTRQLFRELHAPRADHRHAD